MGEIHQSRGFRVNVKMEEIVRVLGYGKKRIPERVETAIQDIEKTAHTLVTTACAYRYLKNEEFSHSKYLSCVNDIVLCLVTIGHRLENTVEEYKTAGELSQAVLLDTYGSAAAEGAADAAEEIIKKEILDMGLKCSSRFSPGYGDWDVAEQKWIVPALEGKAIGVYLTEGCMMVPRKSITFAMTYGKEPVQLLDGDMCEVCEIENCRFKRS